MTLVVQILVFVLIVRACVLGGYHPVIFAILYGVVDILTTMVATAHPLFALKFGVVSGLLAWLVLTLLKRTDGAAWLWWPLLVVGFLIPFAATAAIDWQIMKNLPSPSATHATAVRARAHAVGA